MCNYTLELITALCIFLEKYSVMCACKVYLELSFVVILKNHAPYITVPCYFEHVKPLLEYWR